MPLPDLSGIVQPSDVKQKGKGAYAADYLSWAKTMYYINKHAPGWLPAFKTTADGSLVQAAPNGTCYVTCYFLDVDSGNTTPDWHFAVTDNQNRPIPYDKISSTDICNATRRGLCSCAAEVFSLAYQLWAREEIGESFSSETDVPAQNGPKDSPQKAPIPHREPGDNVRDEQLEAQLVDLLSVLPKGDANSFLKIKQDKWNLGKGGSRVAQMSNSQMRECIEELNEKQ